jgi:sugar phosphate isomerase/epimerase
MSKSPIFVTLGAFGVDLVRRDGQEAFLADIAAAGATGAEIRRELFDGPYCPLHSLRKAATDLGLRLRYSAPFELFRFDGTLALDDLAELVAEAETLGAEALKICLGHYAGGIALDELRRLVDRSFAKILVENDQTSYGGRWAPIAAFMGDCQRDGIDIRATFDIGNWRWSGDDAAAAARGLAPYVRYVHCKAVASQDDRLITVPLDPDDRTWRDLVASFAGDLPRAIEFPLAGEDRVAVTRRYVELLASA